MPHRLISIGVFLMCLSACSPQEEKPVTLAINPWPGYEFLYLAEKKGFFDAAGAKVKLVELGSLGDVQRAYMNGYVDGIASTLIEAVQAQALSGNPLSVVMVPDYSNGGDVIIADKRFSSLQDLKGKKIGCEVSSLGIFLLQRALVKAGMQLGDVNVVNVEQEQGELALKEGRIDAFVTYPPFSVSSLKNPQHHVVFSSEEIPGEVIDTVSISKAVLTRQPALVSQLHQAWQMALDYYAKNPQEAASIMAQREGISADEFVSALTGMKILSQQEQQALLAQMNHRRTLGRTVCETLVQVEALKTDCRQLPDLFDTSVLSTLSIK